MAYKPETYRARAEIPAEWRELITSQFMHDDLAKYKLVVNFPGAPDCMLAEVFPVWAHDRCEINAELFDDGHVIDSEAVVVGQTIQFDDGPDRYLIDTGWAEA